MYRIDNATAADALPAPTAPGPNPDGYFTEGNPATGLPATVVDAEWANMLQEEVANVVLAAGGALDKADRTQLAAAIADLIAAAVPSYPGKVGQVVQTVMTDIFSTNSTTLVDITGFTVDITPQDPASKVLVRAAIALGQNQAYQANFALFRGATQIGLGDAAGSRIRVIAGDTGADANGLVSTVFEFLDSPGVDTPLTYKVQMMARLGTAYINRSVQDTDSALFPRAISTLTATEILP